MFNAIDTATSGLVAQRIRMNTIASNIAGADLVYDATEGGPYKRRAVIFSAGRDAGHPEQPGVHVSRIEKQPVYRFKYDPTHPYADANGYVKMPGINQTLEMINAMEAARAYEANLAAIDISKSMLQSSLRLLA